MQEMGTLYGAYLLFTLGCTFYALITLLPKLPRGLLNPHKKLVKPVAGVIVVALYLFQNTYQHQWSTEAQAMHHFEDMLILWETNQERAVLEMNSLSTSIRPWKSEPDPYDE